MAKNKVDTAHDGWLAAAKEKQAAVLNKNQAEQRLQKAREECTRAKREYEKLIHAEAGFEAEDDDLE